MGKEFLPDTISHFLINESDEVINRYKIIDIKGHQVFNDKLNIITIQLDNFRKGEEELVTDLALDVFIEGFRQIRGGS